MCKGVQLLIKGTVILSILPFTNFNKFFSQINFTVLNPNIFTFVLSFKFSHIYSFHTSTKFKHQNIKKVIFNSGNCSHNDVMPYVMPCCYWFIRVECELSLEAKYQLTSPLKLHFFHFFRNTISISTTIFCYLSKISEDIFSSKKFVFYKLKLIYIR